MNRSIKNKILGSVVLIVIVSLTLSSLLAYWRFFFILENQTIHDNDIYLQQTVNQMNQLVDDIEKYAGNIVNDELLQTFSNKLTYESVYDELLAYSDVNRQLLKFNVLRNYLDSMAIVRSDGKVFWSPFSIDTYYDDELKKPWYQEAIQTGEKSGFTVPHVLQNLKETKVISFYILFPTGGVLLLNINYEAFEQVVGSLHLSFDKYAWMRNDGTMLLNNGMPTDSQEPEALKLLEKHGFVFKQALSAAPWSIMAYTSREQFYHKIESVIFYGIIFLVLCLVFCLLMFVPIISTITKPISQMSKAMKQVSMGNYNIHLSFHSKDELAVLKSGFELMLQNIQLQMKEKAEQEAWKRRVSAELLFAQINPHFIYNTLNTVVYLSRKQKHQEIEEMVESFIGILQDAVQIEETGVFTTLSREKELIDHYVRIQRYRYADRFELRWDIDDGLDSICIPKSCLQPLVENAIFHGVAGMDEVGIIMIQMKRSGDDRLNISVQDNGQGMSADKVAGIFQNTPSFRRQGKFKQVGLRNIQERIRYLCGDQYGLEMVSEEGKGTAAIMVLPLTNEEML